MSVRDSQDTPPAGARIRIGELSRRTEVAPDTLRAWERRYGLLRPQRSAGGFRLYDRGDEARVVAMQALIASGHSAGEAARLALSEEPTRGAGPRTGDSSAARLRAALERFDDVDANALLDEALATLSVEAVLERVILPCMRSIGERWEEGAISVAQEHFATNVIRGRLMAIARNWGAGHGPAALLACPPGEQHDLGLLAFGVVLRDRGWRVVYLGPDTPIETIARTAAERRPAAVVLAAVAPSGLEAGAAELRELARTHRLLLGGGDEVPELARRIGAESLDPDPIRSAVALAASG